jgi:hypothetical protein
VRLTGEHFELGPFELGPEEQNDRHQRPPPAFLSRQ